MRRRILAQMLLIPFIVLLLTVLLSSLLYRDAFSEQLRSDLERNMAIVKACPPGDDFIAHLEKCSESDVRITLIAEDGRVIYESDPNAPSENHSDRPEIQKAIASGSGSDERRSASLGYDTQYYAEKLENGNILRLAVRSSGAYVLYNRELPMVLIACICILGVGLILSKKLTEKLVTPIESMAEHISEEDLTAPYPELMPFADKLKRNQDSQREIENLRQEFTANVSHELKTPLTSISGYAEMIEMGIAKQEDVKSFAAKIQFEASRLLSLIGDIIQLSELDSFKCKDDFVQIDLLDAAHNAEEYLALNAEKYGISITVTGYPVVIQGCPSQIEELIYNLCDNAIRYNRQNGSVTVFVTMTDGCPTLNVSDTGIGIEKDKIPRIFERFYRIDKGRSKKTGGTGLGLAIVKHIAIRHDAQIHVESTLGVGTNIKITFPKSEDAK